MHLYDFLFLANIVKAGSTCSVNFGLCRPNLDPRGKNCKCKKNVY